jgi:putrescine transport system substrate-binding protein
MSGRPAQVAVAPALAGLALVALAATLSACQRASPGREEPVLNIYNWADYIGRDTVPAFERATGVKVIYDTYDSDATMETKMMTGDSGYDVVTASMDYMSRQIKAGVYSRLDKSRLPNWALLDPHTLAIMAKADPGNEHAVPYLHAVNGFSYNVDMVRARDPEAPLGSLDMLFKPEVIAKFADCGVTFLDSPEDVLQLALNYLKLDPNTTREADYRAAEVLILAVRPYIRNFDSSGFMSDLANRELCIAMSWSSDYATIRERAHAAGSELNLAFTVPREGANVTYEGFLIPEGAPHPEAAYRFLNFILQPRVIADITNETNYPNDNLAARAFVKKSLLDDPAIYPPPETWARLYQSLEVSAATERIRTRVWTRIKTGR